MKGIKKIIIASLNLLLLPLSAFASSFWDFEGGTNSNGDWWLEGTVGSGSGGGIENVYGLPEGSILGIISGLMYWFLAIFAMVGIIGFVISGIMYLISSGETSMIDRAKASMKWSLVGVIVGLSGMVVMQAVFSMLDMAPGF